jgi:hypothetical protein
MFTLPWLPEGSYAYVFVAKAGGYWKSRGFDDVDIPRGHGVLAAAQEISQGQFDLGLASASELILLADKGVNLRDIAIMDYDPTMAVCSLLDVGLYGCELLRERMAERWYGAPFVSEALPQSSPRSGISGLQLELAVDLDRNAVWQFGHADCGARVLAGLRAEQLVKEIRGAIDDLRHAVESRRDIDHSEQPHHALDAVEIAELRLQAGQNRQGNRARGRVALFDAKVAPDLALPFNCRTAQIAAMPRNEHQ